MRTKLSLTIVHLVVFTTMAVSSFPSASLAQTDTACCTSTDTVPPKSAQAKLESLGIDERILLAINHFGESAAWLDKPAEGLSNTAAYIVASIPIGIYGYGLVTKNTTTTYAGASMILAEGFSALFTEGLKNIVRRPRPYHVLTNCRCADSASPTWHEPGYSFPSGHATATWCFASGLWLHYPKWYVIAPSALYALSVSLARPYLSVHYPSDIFVGALVGVATSFFFWKMEDKWFPHWGRALNP